MTKHPHIRRAVRRDMEAVAALAARLVRYHHQLDPQRFLCVEPVEPGYERWLTHELDNQKAVVLVAEEDPTAGRVHGPIVGYAYGRMEPRDWNALLDACGVLHDVYVSETARSRGHGQALVEACAAALQEMGASRIVLHTATQNAAAQKMFEKLGFRPTMVEMTRETE